MHGAVITLQMVQPPEGSERLDSGLMLPDVRATIGSHSTEVSVTSLGKLADQALGIERCDPVLMFNWAKGYCGVTAIALISSILAGCSMGGTSSVPSQPAQHDVRRQIDVVVDQRTGRRFLYTVCAVSVRRAQSVIVAPRVVVNPCGGSDGIDLGGMAAALAVDPLASPIMVRSCLIAAARQSAKDAAQAARDRINQARSSGSGPTAAQTAELNKAADKIDVASDHYYNHADELVGTPESQMTPDQRFTLTRIGQIAVGLRDRSIGYVLAAGGREIYIEKTDVWQQGVPSVFTKPLGEYFVIIFDVSSNKLLTIFTTSAKGVDRAVESTVRYGEKVGDTGDVDLSTCWG